MPNIRVDQDVYDLLQNHARPFVDTPNSVLRRLLKLDLQSEHGEPKQAESSPQKDSARHRKSKSRSRTHSEPKHRAPAGSLLPEGEYVMPLLRTLAQRGGHAPAREVISAVGLMLGDKLTQTDREKLPSGVVRWENRVQFVRLRLVEEGLLSRDTPRGVWSLTDAGRTRVAELSQRR